ncbi:oxidoreductase [Aureococcus anophagefferens]|nr:oxidoreductase [Aureococcus anophagefferens]
MHYATALEIEEKRCAPLPRVVIGCWQLLERDSSRDAAVRTLRAYAAAGFTAFDTADIYGPSESILGAFREAHDGPLTFHTKYVTQDSSKANAVAVNKQSRKSLRVESLDLVQFHWWDFSDGAYVQYSLLDRRPENGVIALATKRGLQLTCFGTAAGGWLSDKYLGAPEPTRSDVSKGTVSLRMYKSSLDAWGPGASSRTC